MSGKDPIRLASQLAAMLGCGIMPIVSDKQAIQLARFWEIERAKHSKHAEQARAAAEMKRARKRAARLAALGLPS